MNRIDTQWFKTPYGDLLLGAYAGQLCLCDWRGQRDRQAVDRRLQRGLEAEYVERDQPILQNTRAQLNEYFAGERQGFDLPLKRVGSAFQQSVWQYLLTLPYGQTTHYADMAHALGNDKAVRAVASANAANALSIIVPCHRIIGRDGKLVGYAGGLEAKAGLLRLESAIFNRL